MAALEQGEKWGHKNGGEPNEAIAWSMNAIAWSMRRTLCCLQTCIKLQSLRLSLVMGKHRRWVFILLLWYNQQSQIVGFASGKCHAITGVYHENMQWHFSSPVILRKQTTPEHASHYLSYWAATSGVLTMYVWHNVNCSCYRSIRWRIWRMQQCIRHHAINMHWSIYRLKY